MATHWLRGWFRSLPWLVGPGAVAVVVYANRDTLATALRLARDAALWWLVPALAAIGGLYLCRAAVYRIPLTLLGYSFTRRFLWTTALIATSVHQLFPTGGASGYAFLTFALHRKGVSGGQASLIALIDTLSYAIALATLVIASLLYLAATGGPPAWRLPVTFGPGLVVLALAAYLYALQGDQRRFTGLAGRLADRVAALLGRRWSGAPVRRFLDEYYAGKAAMRRRPSAFYRMLGLQYLAVGCDATALYLAFLALGRSPRLTVVLMGFVVSMAALAVVGLPGGGGTFEVVMSLFFARHGLPPAAAVAAVILYRVVSFWIPVLGSLAALLVLRQRRSRQRRRPASRP